MSSWLASLPHQIPFRAASSATRLDDRSIEGVFVCTTGDSLSAGGQPVQIFLLEAMAQLAGGLVFPEAGRPGFLSAIDSCTVQREIRVGDVVRIRVDLEAQLGGLYRFQGTGSVGGVELVRGRFCLAEPDGSQW